MMTYRPENFILQELVAPEIYKARGDAAWELLDSRALLTLQQLRKQFGPTTVNSWHAGGHFSESGLRVFSSTTGAVYSQHKYGRAFDCKFKQVTPQEAYEFILLNGTEFPFLTTLEEIGFTSTWLHFDVRLNTSDRIRIVKP